MIIHASDLRKTKAHARFQRQLPLYIMLLPAFCIVLIYNYMPLFGLTIAFQDFNPALGFDFSKQPWVGLENFRFVLAMPSTIKVIWNTLFISSMKLVALIVVPVMTALLLNEMGCHRIKRWVQTVIYLPYFLSWVILGGILVQILSPSTGIVSDLFRALGLPTPYWLGDPKVFPFTLVVTDLWKEFGFKAIVYLAALAGISPELYEAAEIDGAGRIKQVWYITLPCIAPTIILMTTLAIGSILSAGFEQVFNLINPSVYSTGDIIDTMVYRVGIQQAQYGLATAVGMFKSVVSCVLVTLSYYLAKRFAGYTVF
jgi:putative aldouronate transport system permease protein